jgi:hypothetical protein
MKTDGRTDGRTDGAITVPHIAVLPAYQWVGAIPNVSPDCMFGVAQVNG